MLDPGLPFTTEGIGRSCSTVLSDRPDHDPVIIDCQSGTEAVSGTPVCDFKSP